MKTLALGEGRFVPVDKFVYEYQNHKYIIYYNINSEMRTSAVKYFYRTLKIDYATIMSIAKECDLIIKQAVEKTCLNASVRYCFFNGEDDTKKIQYFIDKLNSINIFRVLTKQNNIDIISYKEERMLVI